MSTSLTRSTGQLGESIGRREDGRLVSGSGRYVSDVRLPGMLHACFVRSSEAHAEIVDVDTSVAKGMPGIVGVLTAADLTAVSLVDGNKIPNLRKTPQPIIAASTVHFVGEVICVVIGSDRYVAEDAAETVAVEYKRLEPVLSPGDPRNVDASVSADRIVYDEAISHEWDSQRFEGAAHVVSIDYQQARVAACPLEARSGLADFNPWRNQLSFWGSTQSPHVLRAHLARSLDISTSSVRVVVGDVGGAFGQKIPAAPEELLIAHASRRLGKPVRWVEDRTENLVAAPHAKDQAIELALALDEDGRFLAMKGDVVGDAGAYSFNSSSSLVEPYYAARLLPGPYVIPSFYCRVRSVLTNKSPIAPYRGVGYTAAHVAREALIDKAAAAINVDPVKIRLDNLVGESDLPYRSPTGLVIRQSPFADQLNKATEAMAKAERRSVREGRSAGVGICMYLEPTGWGSEGMEEVGWHSFASHDSASARLEVDGRTVIAVGVSSQGQGHETTLAQVAADALSVDVETVVVAPIDTDHNPVSIGGTRASRTAAVLGGAVSLASLKLRAKIIEAGARLMEADASDCDLRDGAVQVEGDPGSSVTIPEIAAEFFGGTKARPKGGEGETMIATAFYDPPSAYSSGAVMADVEVDSETGGVRVAHIVSIDDCGTVINPAVVRGQIVGGLAQAIGQVFLEEVVYDEQGQVQSGTFADYLLPSSTDMPRFTIDHGVDQGLGWRGIKGVGEAGMIGGPAALANATYRALSAESATDRRLPLDPARVKELLRRDDRPDRDGNLL